MQFSISFYEHVKPFSVLNSSPLFILNRKRPTKIAATTTTTDGITIHKMSELFSALFPLWLLVDAVLSAVLPSSKFESISVLYLRRFCSNLSESDFCLSVQVHLDKRSSQDDKSPWSWVSVRAPERMFNLLAMYSAARASQSLKWDRFMISNQVFLEQVPEILRDFDSSGQVAVFQLLTERTLVVGTG